MAAASIATPISEFPLAVDVASEELGDRPSLPNRREKLVSYDVILERFETLPEFNQPGPETRIVRFAQVAGDEVIRHAQAGGDAPKLELDKVDAIADLGRSAEFYVVARRQDLERAWL